MTETRAALRVGYNAGIPNSYKHAAWGARMIYPADLAWDQQNLTHFGDMDATEEQRERDRKLLTDWLNGTKDGYYPKPKGEHPLALAFQAAEARPVRSDENREVVLYSDEIGVIVANPNASNRYLYCAAFLRQAP
jgi:hypothetical protein